MFQLFAKPSRFLILLLLWPASALSHQNDTENTVSLQDVSRPGGDFELESAEGPFHLRDLTGKLVVMSFGFTSCPDVCPTTLVRIGRGFEQLNPGETSQVRALFISVDPDRDSIEQLTTYTRYFHPNIIGLRGNKAMLDKVTSQYGVSYRRVAMPDSILGYSIAHSTELILLDKQGHIKDILPHNTSTTQLLHRLRAALTASP